jgi:hypothetical protein
MEEENDDEESKPHDRLFKERRLLLVASVVLLAHQLLGITVSKGADTLGFHFDVEDPSKIWWAMWLMWAWTAICYVQQLNSIRPRTMYPEDRATETRAKLADRVITLRVRRAAIKHLHLIFPRHLKAKFEVRLLHRFHKQPTGQKAVVLTIVAVYARWKQSSAASEEVMADVFARSMYTDKWELPGGGCGHEGGESYFHRQVGLPSLPVERARWIRAISAVWASMSTSFLTDYYAPLLIGGAPLFVAALQFGMSLAR